MTRVAAISTRVGAISTIVSAIVMHVGAAPVAAAGRQATPAVPLDATAAIIDAFRTHSVVALPDAHGDEQLHAFTLSLIRDPRLPAVIDDIVIEPGNARYQDVVDRFVRGEEVPYQSLRHAFDDTTQAHVWGGTMSEEVVRAVRSVNMRLPREQQLRVLLGDPPIDWDRITTRAEHWTWMEMRDSFPAALIQTEVLARQRRALVVYGGGHLQRNQIMSNYDMGHWEAQTIVSVLERTTPTRVFTIWADDDLATRHPGSASWRTPSIALVRGTALGAADFASYWSPPARFAFQDGKSVPVPRDQWRPLRMEEQFDAILYLGPSSGTERPRSPAICADRSRLDARLRRMELGAPRPEVERLKAFCASATPK